MSPFLYDPKDAPVGYGAACLCGSIQFKWFLIELAAKLAGSMVEMLSPFPLKPLILKMKILFLKIVFSLFYERVKQM